MASPAPAAGGLMSAGTSLASADNEYLARPGAGAPGFVRLMELSRLCGLSRCYTTAVKVGLFTELRAAAAAAAAESPSPPPSSEEGGFAGLTAQQVAERLGFRATPGFRGVRDFLDVLVSLDVLARTGGGSGDEEARYRNTPEADQYLCQQSPDYIGGIAIVEHDRFFPLLLHLEHTLRTGRQPPNRLVASALATFSGDGGEEGTTGGDMVEFAIGMTGCNRGSYLALAKKFDWSRVSSLGDFGGSAGAMCCAVAAAHPHLKATTLDLPQMRPAAEKYIGMQAGLGGRVAIADVDFFADGPLAPPGHAFDAVHFGMVLHDWPLAKKKLLVRKAHDALPASGGVLLATDYVIDDARRANPFGLLMSLNMLMEFEDAIDRDFAFDYTAAEFSAWAKEAGFARVERLHLAGPASCMVAYKE